ncbi:MAG: hypothetical protein HY810_03885 [Candidatus Omnitrophica bacterium]|nr:hypothetical protein [Candidatus Omnitrophota bacterium]
MKNKILLFLSVTVLTLAVFTASGYSFWDNLFNSNSSVSAENTGNSKSVLQFTDFKHIDTGGTGIETFHMLIPKDWQFSGGVRWILNNPGMPAVISFKLKNPGGIEELEVFPNQPFFWTNNQMVLSMFPVGAYYFGSEVAPPVSALEALERITIPRFRSDVSNIRVIKKEPLPELAQILNKQAIQQPGINYSAEGAKIRVEYVKDGREIEEEIFAVVEAVSFSMQSMMGVVTNINWTVDYVFSFKAEKGRLDSHYKTFQTIVHSFTLNPQWFNKYNQVVEYLVQRQIQQINNIGQLSKIISQTHNEISDMIMDSYNYRQKVNDRIADNFSKSIRGVEGYYDPGQDKAVELPNGYRDAWSNKLGEYILSDDPNFNPNVNSATTWEKMRKTE